jgi:histidinol phosphatase-like enzyme
MIYRAVEDFKLNQNQLLFIGDEEKDLEAAKAAKINGFVVNEKLGDIGNFGLIRNASKKIKELYGVVLE